MENNILKLKTEDIGFILSGLYNEFHTPDRNLLLIGNVIDFLTSEESKKSGATFVLNGKEMNIAFNDIGEFLYGCCEATEKDLSYTEDMIDYLINCD